MDTIQDLLRLIGIVLGIIVAAASIVAFFRVNLAKNQIEALRGDRDDLSDRVDRLTEALDDAKKEKEKQDDIIKEQARNIKNLERVVTGKEQLDHLQTSLDAHDQRIDERHATISKNFAEVIDNLRTSNELVMSLSESNQELQAAMLLFLQRERA